MYLPGQLEDLQSCPVSRDSWVTLRYRVGKDPIRKISISVQHEREWPGYFSKYDEDCSML